MTDNSIALRPLALLLAAVALLTYVLVIPGRREKRLPPGESTSLQIAKRSRECSERFI